MRRSLKLGIAICVTVLASLFAAAPLLINDESLRATLTDQLSTALGIPVSIEKLTFRLLPHPAVTLQNSLIELDESPTQHIRINRMHTSLSIRALLKGDISVTRLEITGLQLSEARIRRIQNMLPGNSGSLEQFQLPLHLSRARLKGVTWETTDGNSFGPFNATFVWKQGIRPDSVDISRDDGRIKLRLLPDSDGIDFHLHAFDIDLPTEKPYRVDHIDTHGRYSQSTISITGADIKALDSHATVSGSLDWSNRLSVQARVIDSLFNLPTILKKVELTSIPGVVAAECDIQLDALIARDLFKSPTLDCTLNYQNSNRSSLIGLKTRPKNESKLNYQLTAKNFTMPVDPQLHFDQLTANGELSGNRVSIQAADIQGYQGKLIGSGALSWSKGWRFEFDARSHHLQIEPILAKFDNRSLNGFLDSDCSGKLRSVKFSTLAKDPTIKCNFDIQDGVLYNADLENAASLIQNTETAHGNTPFNRLSGKLNMADGRTRLDKLAISSNALEASGGFAIDRNEQVTGELSVGLKHTNNIVSIPLVISGSSDNPTLRPTKSAIAGGAAGTLILGPGVGTAIGVKVGEAVQKFTRWLKPETDVDKDNAKSRK